MASIGLSRPQAAMRGRGGALISSPRAVATSAHTASPAFVAAASPPAARAVQGVGAFHPNNSENVARSLGGPARDGVSEDRSMSLSGLLRPTLRRTVVEGLDVGFFVVGSDGTPVSPDARERLEGNIDKMLANLYPVTPLDRAVRVYDDEFPLSWYTARTKKSPNLDLDLLEREWRLRHHDHFNYLLHPDHVTPAMRGVVVKYTKRPPAKNGRQFELPERTNRDKGERDNGTPDQNISPVYLYQLDSNAPGRPQVDTGAFATPRNGLKFELLFPNREEAPPSVQLLFRDNLDKALPVHSMSASVRRGSRSSTSPVDAFDPFAVYVGCEAAVKRQRNTTIGLMFGSLSGPAIYRPCPLRMDVTSTRAGGQADAVRVGDFTRGGKVMKRDVLAAAEDGLASAVRMGMFYGSGETGPHESMRQELLDVRCADWYVMDPRVSNDYWKPLRVVVELARPGVPFAAISIFNVGYRADARTETLVAHTDSAECLLRRRICSTFSALDTSFLPSQATVGRAYNQLLAAVDALRRTLEFAP